MDRPPTPAQRKRQLLGHWRSDSKRTLAELAQRRFYSKKRIEFLRTIFGKLEVWYRPTTFVSTFKGKKSIYKYKILGADSYSIVILLDQKPPLVGPKIQLITFEEDYFWINLGGGAREFFKRIKARRP
jgi:hypothetical protein